MHTALLVGWTILAVAVLFVLSRPVVGISPIGTLLDPLDGLYRTARIAEHPPQATLTLEVLNASVEVFRDERGVPHIFAQSDRDAIIAMGYVVAQDRLFQLDFIPRAASGRLAEVFGAQAVETDRFLRSTGMELGARRNAERILADGGIELKSVEWFGLGANAYIDSMEERDLPFEFRLLGYKPARYSLMHPLRLLQYMTFDLAFGRADAAYTALKQDLSAADYEMLYPLHQQVFVPIIPEAGGAKDREGADSFAQAIGTSLLNEPDIEEWRGTLAEGFLVGKGSNNWAVHGDRSATGAPILAGDMHLGVSLPAIWYEVHLVTPTMNSYGVAIPGTPLPVEAFTDHLAWAFTNTGGDVLDRYRLTLDKSGKRYLYEGAYRDLEMVPDTLFVKGSDPIVDTLYYAHWGPVSFDGAKATAMQWTGHDTSRTLAALWAMHHAETYAEFEQALRKWDTPMQNILVATNEKTIAIRSTGYMPIREQGVGVGLLDGSTNDGAWVGRVPFEDLPHSVNPAQGFLTSTNQQPADSTYPYYMGHDWRSAYRSLRIDTLLRARPKHSVADMKAYQADVHAIQRDLFVPLLDTLSLLSSRADSLRLMLSNWNGVTGVDRHEPLILDEYLRALHRLAWDETVFEGRRTPGEPQLWQLLKESPESRWLDVQATLEQENAAGLMRLALEATADTLARRYGWGTEHWRWGDHHQLLVRHVTQSPALKPLWRGPVEYPGFSATLSPAGSRRTTHTASWRMVVDFSETPPVGYGVYPGGASGNPLSSFYDMYLPAFVSFEHYPLRKPTIPDSLDEGLISSRITMKPNL